MADQIILKNSSNPGERPTQDSIFPGEISLNVNAQEPGAFIKVTDGSIVKVGPASVMPTSPRQSPSKGESWLDESQGTLKIGTEDGARKVWRTVAAPFLGGGGNCVFVAPEYPFSTDNLKNDGRALPFQSLNRAVLELTKIYIGNVLSGFSPSSSSSKYTIYLAPGLVSAYNEAGVSEQDFSVNLSARVSGEVSYSDLVRLNSTSGGLVIPSGISVVGMDRNKSVVRPCFVPRYKNYLFPESIQGGDDPLSAILKCSGNSLLSGFTVLDKLDKLEIADVEERNSYAIFKTRSPHCLKFNDIVTVDLSSQVDQSSGTFYSGVYYAIPVSSSEFFLSEGDQTGENASPYVPFSSIPETAYVVGPKMTGSLTQKSAHRLRAISNANFSEISEYYSKVQKAFPSLFGGRIVDGSRLVNPGDYVVVAPTSSEYPDNKVVNSVREQPLKVSHVTLRSEYGMCWGDFDGSTLAGFKSVYVDSCKAESIQNDPSVYEVYTTLVNESGSSEQKWWGLSVAKYLSTPVESRPLSVVEVAVESQLDLLNNTPISNIRYFYSSVEENVQGDPKSIGVPDLEKDYRHFGFRARNGAELHLDSVETSGPAVGVWALNGGVCYLSNSISSYGTLSLKSEGFLGINTIGGADSNSKGFVLEGIQRPLALTKSQVQSDENKEILSLGSRVKSVYLEDPYTQVVELTSDFSPSYILPYSLSPGTALWIETADCTYRGFFVTDGGPTVVTGLDDPSKFAKLRIRSSDTTIPYNPEFVSTMGVPYIRRFKDPREEFDRAYTFLISNTSPTAIPPQTGSVLRLNQTSQQQGGNLLRPNVQLDPGSSGGWGRVFSVEAVGTGTLSSSPQFNNVLADSNQDLSYYVAVTTTDFGRPWVQGNAFKSSNGTYATYKNRNWYCAENNLWDYAYYGGQSSLNPEFGPFSVAPNQPSSPFVDSSVSEKQELVSICFQGTYGPDSYSELYQSGSYLRGATLPHQCYTSASNFDGDDGSSSLGLCLTDQTSPSPSLTTYTVSQAVIVQSEQTALLYSETGGPRRYRPAIIEFSVLSASGIVNPRQGVSVVKLSKQGYWEYVRIVSLNGSTVRAIRLTPGNSSYESQLPSEAVNYLWPAQTSVTVCSANPTPSPRLYDPDWGNTKSSVFRFFEIMGYSKEVMRPLLEPKYWGDRLLSMNSLSEVQPTGGYALYSGKWPLEFNRPSVVSANSHTWLFPGYYSYSRGLLKYQSTDLTRKLSADSQAYTLWGGRMKVTGMNDKGELVRIGNQTEALTGNTNRFEVSPYQKANKQLYEAQDVYEFPSQVVVFSADDISSGFNGTVSSFELRRSGLPIPLSQLSSESSLVSLGGVVQKPDENYSIVNGSILFTTPPPSGLSCDIRVITSEDSSRTLKALSLNFSESFDGVSSTYSVETQSLTPQEIKELSYTEINPQNTFVGIGGVQQIPLSPVYPFSYSVQRDSPTEIFFNFTGPPPAGSTSDIRVFSSGNYWSLRGINPVRVFSLDPLEFDGNKTSFTLTFDGEVVDASTISSEKIVFSLGGSVQIPNVSYKVENSVLTFLGEEDPPTPGTSCDLRVITNSNFSPCRDISSRELNFSVWGPGMVLTLASQAGLLNLVP